MKRSGIMLAIAAALLIVGCGKKEETRPDAPPAAPPQQGLSTPLPERPDPNVPKDAPPELPKPGQANDHSSPEFKGGGVSDKK